MEKPAAAYESPSPRPGIQTKAPVKGMSLSSKATKNKSLEVILKKEIDF